mgnify:CR=1 FL=1
MENWFSVAEWIKICEAIKSSNVRVLKLYAFSEYSYNPDENEYGRAL